MGHYTSLYFRMLCIAGPSWGIRRGVEARMGSGRNRMGSVSSDEEMGAERKHIGQIIYCNYYNVFVVFNVLVL